MKLNLTDNLFLKLISLFAAIVLWLVVVIISDAEITTTISAEVTLKNTNVVTENGKVFWVEDGTNFVKITVRERRSILEKLNQSDFVLTADMEKDLKYDSMVAIRVECKNKNIEVDEDVKLSHNNVKVSIEDSATEQFPVHVSHTGTFNAGLMVGSMVPEQTIIKVTGPVSIVERIKEVKAVVDVTGLPATTVKNCTLKLYDANGDVIDTTYLNYVGKSDGIDVTVSMLNTKTIPLVFSYSGTPAENYRVADVDWKPELIEIAGNSEVLTALTSLRIPAEAINVEGIDQELQLIIDITEYLPSGVILKDEANASVLVIVEVEYLAPETEQEGTGTQEEETTQPEEPSEESQQPEDTQDTEPPAPEAEQQPEEGANQESTGTEGEVEQKTEDIVTDEESGTEIDGTEGQNI